jgi:hypothetical protein
MSAYVVALILFWPDLKRLFRWSRQRAGELFRWCGQRARELIGLIVIVLLTGLWWWIYAVMPLTGLEVAVGIAIFVLAAIGVYVANKDSLWARTLKRSDAWAKKKAST